MKTTLQEVRQAFAERVKGVNDLVSFDDLVLDHLIDSLGDIQQQLEDLNIHSKSGIIANRIAQVRNIRNAQSLRPYYETIHNQGIVLLVSYFDATMGDVFRVAIATALREGLEVPVRTRSVDLSWASLTKPDAPIERLIADRIVKKDGISFQDMKSISRAFSDSLRVTIEKGEDVNDIILGQAARHVLVHAGGEIDDRFLNQVADAHPRRLKTALPRDGALRFDPAEVNALGTAMSAFVDRTIARMPA